MVTSFLESAAAALGGGAGRCTGCADRPSPASAGLGVVGRDPVGLDAVGLDAVGLDAVGLDAVGLDAVGLDAVGLDAVGVDAACRASFRRSAQLST
jgi:hypothetical protein